MNRFQYNNRRLVFVMLALGLTAPLLTGRGRTAPPSAAPSAAPVAAGSPTAPVYRRQWVSENEMWQWADQPWTGDDRPYRQARAQIDAAARGSQSRLSGLVERYEDAYRKNLDDPLTLFRWAYATYTYTQKYGTDREMHDRLSPISDDLFKTPNPQTYNYARIEFLIADVFDPSVRYRSLAERLVRSDPKDYDTRFDLLSLLVESYMHPDYDRVLAGAHTLIRLEPKKRGPYTLIGETFLFRSQHNKSRADAEKAIAAYRKYLQLAPPEDEFRKRAHQIIQLIQKQMANYPAQPK